MFDKNKFKNKKACVLGGGKTGRASAGFLSKKGFKVLLSDASPHKPARLPRGVEVETGGHSDKVLSCAFIVKSPGIKPDIAILKKAAAKKIPVFSEAEVALAYLPKTCKIYAVTGTNGKTTTTMLLAEVLKEYCRHERKGRKTWTAGNIGTPLSALAGKIKPGDLLALEMSSYQLEDSTYFAPHAACVLNLTPDHLEHHGSYKKYLVAKKKIFAFQGVKDIAVINAGDKNSLKFVKGIKSRLFSFATTPAKKLRAHAFFDGDEIVFSSGIRLRPPALPGVHNVENAMACALMTLPGGVPSGVVQRAFKKFKAVEHRIETVVKHKGITCINDSKSTNVDSTVTALKALGEKKNIWLILGGRDKGFPYAPLMPLLEKFVKGVLAVGEAAPKIKKELAAFKVIYDTPDIKDAVSKALEKGESGDILLLSPACASFDQFKNFEERGEYFKKECLKRAKGE